MATLVGMAETPTWAEMLGRAMGASFDTAVGTVAWSDPEEDPPGDRGSLRFAFAEPDRWRIEDDEGPFVITGGDQTFVRTAPGLMAVLGDGHVGLQHDPRHLIDGPTVAASLSERNDFSRPIGPAEEAEIDGRLGWRFVLAPPPHKPAPLEVVLDDETGVVLEYRSLGADYWEMLTSFEVNVSLDDESFTWTGEVDTAWVDERLVHEERARAVSEHPWPSPTYWPSGVPLDVIEGDVDNGSFVAVMGGHVASQPILARWRPGSPPVRLEGHIRRLAAHHRWERDGFHWLLATDDDISPEDLQRIIDSIPPG